jgi:hypothetical protein
MLSLSIAIQHPSSSFPLLMLMMGPPTDVFETEKFLPARMMTPVYFETSVGPTRAFLTAFDALLHDGLSASADLVPFLSLPDAKLVSDHDRSRQRTTEGRTGSVPTSMRKGSILTFGSVVRQPRSASSIADLVDGSTSRHDKIA